MKKYLLLVALLFPAAAFAQGYNPYSGAYGMMGGGSGGFLLAGLLGLIYFSILSFVFSVIFWLVHNWINKK